MLSGREANGAEKWFEAFCGYCAYYILYKLGQDKIVNTYRDFFFNSRGFTVMEINTEIAELTAKIRAEFRFKLPDALRLAIFEYNNCDFFVTNDKQLKAYNKSKVYILGENN